MLIKNTDLKINTLKFMKIRYIKKFKEMKQSKIT